MKRMGSQEAPGWSSWQLMRASGSTEESCDWAGARLSGRDKRDKNHIWNQGLVGIQNKTLS